MFFESCARLAFVAVLADFGKYDYSHDYGHIRCFEESAMREIKASEFKAKCLKLLDEVAATGDVIVVTKHGKPVARVEREVANKKKSLIGSMKDLIEVTDPNDNLFSCFSAEDMKSFESNRERRAAILLESSKRKRRKRERSAT
jgi:antitoxin (DNA-binding transcriptional repressor) of toxin-antitoxin stability system